MGKGSFCLIYRGVHETLLEKEITLGKENKQKAVAEGQVRWALATSELVRGMSLLNLNNLFLLSRAGST